MKDKLHALGLDWEYFGRLSRQSRIIDDFSCGTNSQKYLPAEENKVTDM